MGQGRGGHRFKVLGQRCRGGCEEEYFDAANGNDLELAAYEGGGSGDNKQLQRKLDGYLGVSNRNAD